MRILYLSISYIPSRRASSVQVMKMCHAFAKHGHEVSLVSKRTPERQEIQNGDDYHFYGVTRNFEITKLDRPVTVGGGIVYAREMERVLYKKRHEVDLVYSRDAVGAWNAIRLGMPVVFEAHGLPANAWSRFFWKKIVASPYLKRFVTISAALRDELVRQGLAPSSTPACVAHDGADTPSELLTAAPPPHPTLALEGPHLGYVGQLWRGKGMELIATLAGRMPRCVFHVVGGNDRDVQTWQDSSLPPNVVLHGFVPHGMLTNYYRHFDMLMMPYQKQVYGATGKEDTSRWMSPLKMFEYMATGKPIISSDLPVLREVLEHESNALLVPPDELCKWEEAICRLLGDTELRNQLGNTAKRDLLTQYTWDSRAMKVLDGLEPLR